MKIKRSSLVFLVLCALFLLLVDSGILQYVVAKHASLFVQVLDAVGVPSVVHMPHLSCQDCNDFDLKYVIDAPGGVDCSADHKIFLLVLVISKAENFNKRKNVRHTWGSVSEYKGHSIRTYFVCGKSNNSVTEAQLVEEATFWGDVVQVCIPYFS